MHKHTKSISCWLTLLEIFLFLYVLWIILPQLLMEQRITLAWAFFSMSSDISARNLLVVWIILTTYLCARTRWKKAGLLTWFLRNRTVAFQGMLLFSAVFLVYLNTGRHHSTSGDTIPAKLIPISILAEHDLDLDEFYDGLYEGHRYSVVQQGDHWYSAYPIFPGLTALPFYAAVAWFHPKGFDTWRLTYSLPDGDLLYQVPRFLEHYSASLIAALSVVVVWNILILQIGRNSLALWLTLGYTFGTSLQSTASWALWMHGPSCLFLALTIYGLHQKHIAFNYGMLLAGLCAGWAVACRPTNMIPIALLGFWCVITYRTRAWRFWAGCGIILGGIGIANYLLYHRLLGGYAGQTSLFSQFDPLVLLALLFSPSRGLFLFSPFLLIITVSAIITLRTQWRTRAAFCLYAALALCGLYACWGPWAGGHSFGPRLLTETGLLLILAAPKQMTTLSRHAIIRGVLAGLIMVSCHIHLLGTAREDNGWIRKKFNGQDFRSFWNVRDSQLVWTIYGPSEE